jgi:hypothetical protein
MKGHGRPNYGKAIRRALMAGADPNVGMTRLARDGMQPGKLSYVYPMPGGGARPVPRPFSTNTEPKP